MPWLDKGQVIQSRTTGRFFLVTEEAPVFGSYGQLKYDIWLQPLKPFRDTENHTICVRMTVDQIRAFHIGKDFVSESDFEFAKDIEPWEMDPYYLNKLDPKLGIEHHDW